MDYAAVMAELGTRLDAMDGLRAVADDRGSVIPPVAIVSYPEEIDPHGTYNRGMAFLTLQVMVVVGRPNERATRARAAVWAKDSGPSSVLTVLEAEGYASCADVTVTKISFDAVSIANIVYMAVFFDLKIAGSGA